MSKVPVLSHIPPVAWIFLIYLKYIFTKTLLGWSQCLFLVLLDNSNFKEYIPKICRFSVSYPVLPQVFINPNSPQKEFSICGIHSRDNTQQGKRREHTLFLGQCTVLLSIIPRPSLEPPRPVWWMRVGIDSRLSTISTDLKESNSAQIILGFLSRHPYRAYPPLDRRWSGGIEVFDCKINGHSQWLFKKAIEGFDCKISWSPRLWIKIWHRNKSVCSESNPVQSSRSQSTSCPRKGRLLRFK